MLNEAKYKKRFCEELMAYLLQKYESSKTFYTGENSKQRPQISFERGNPFVKDYYDEMDFRKKEWIHDVLLELEQQKNIVSLTWVKFNEGNELSKVYLNFDQINLAYKLANLEPKLDKINQLLSIIKPVLNHQWEWLQLWAKSTIQRLEQRKQAGLNIAEPGGYKDVVEVLNHLPSINANIPKRVLSQQLFLDSKHFERHVEKPLSSILNKEYPTKFDSNEEMLAYFGIVQQARLVLFKGQIDWTINGEATISSKDFLGGLGISDLTVKHMEIRDLNVEKIIIIENLTSYEQWIRQRSNEQELVIYSGGFPHRSLQIFFKKLSYFLYHQVNQSIPIFHWGDIDMGGILIFNYIKNSFFSSLQPLLMDNETLIMFQENAMEITESYRIKIRKLSTNPASKEWYPVLETMLQLGIRLEQESIYDVSEVSI